MSLTAPDTATSTFVAPSVGAPTPLTFELTVTDAAGNADTDAVVVTVTDVPAADPEATVSFADQDSDGTTVVVDEVFVSEGGFVTIHDTTLATNPFLSVVGVSEYLPPGTHRNVEVRLFDVPGASYDREFDRLEPGNHRAFITRNRNQLNRCFGNNAECAFTADEQLQQIVPRRLLNTA